RTLACSNRSSRLRRTDNRKSETNKLVSGYLSKNINALPPDPAQASHQYSPFSAFINSRVRCELQSCTSYSPLIDLTSCNFVPLGSEKACGPIWRNGSAWRSNSRETFCSLPRFTRMRSEEHTSELQSRENLVCG